MSEFTPDSYYPIDVEGLPVTWEIVKVGDAILDIQPGFASGKHNQEGLGIPHLRPMNVDRLGQVDLSLVKYVSREDGPRLRFDDVLFNNTNSPQLIGKTAWIGQDEGWAFSNHMTRLRVPSDIAPKFVAHQLHYLWMTGYFLYRCVKHVNQASVSSTALADTVPLVIPPLPEQHRIVAEIEKQFTRLDVSVAALKRAQANLKRYRASALKAACEGQLVPTEAELARAEGRDYEPADQLLERILTERRARWESHQNRRGQYKEPAAPDTSDLPELPEGWVWATVGALLTSIKAGKNFKCEERPPEDQEVGVVKVSSVTWGEFDEVESKTCTDSSKVDPTLFIHSGDFLFSRANTIQLVGACVIVKNVNLRLMLSDKILRFAILGNLEKWLLYCLRSALGRSEIERLATGNQESMRNIGQDRIHQIRIPFPPLAEQQRIVAEVERRLSVIQQAEASVEANLKRAERLRQSILKQAFSGQLVPQDPDDEPASVLLERIKAEREEIQAANAVNRKTRRPARRRAQQNPEGQLALPEVTP
ncbi:MAG: hypothetical protein ACE5Q6_11520 [Dehalococcoidia bacterium]